MAPRRPMSTLRDLERRVIEASPPDAGARLLAAVSGGADSIALLHVLARLAPVRGWTVAAAHLDHGLRGPAGEGDRAFVEQTAAGLGVVVHAARRAVARRPGQSPEDAARAVRRAFLLEAADACGAERIALAHTADDLAETVLLRLVRGTGPGGLAAMSVRDGRLWRPLLAVSRDEVREALRGAGLAWRDDETNLDVRFDRNRVRLEILPRLRTLNPRVVDALGRAASIAALDEAVLARLAGEAAGDLVAAGAGGAVALDAERLGRLAPAIARRVVRLAVESAVGGLRGIELRHVEAVLALAGATTGRAVQLPGGCIARAERGRVVLRRPSRARDAAPVPLPVPGEALWQGGRVAARLLEGDAVPADPAAACGPRRALLDASKAEGPLLVRAWRAGDRFRPLGGPGERLVADFLRDAGIAAAERRRLPLVVAGQTIAWIGGHRIDERFRLPRDPGRAVEVVWEDARPDSWLLPGGDPRMDGVVPGR